MPQTRKEKHSMLTSLAFTQILAFTVHNPCSLLVLQVYAVIDQCKIWEINPECSFFTLFRWAYFQKALFSEEGVYHQ